MERLEPQTKNGASDVCSVQIYIWDTDRLVHKVNRANITQSKVLSAEAKAKIRRDTRNG